jgi:predicted acyltransferase
MHEPTARSLAVDLLRGMTLALMIVVNMAIDDERSYGQLLHSVWHGFTLTDAVFPAFLFAVGASLALSIERQRAAGERAFTARVLRRGALLFALGVLLSWVPFFRYDAVTDALVFVDLQHIRVFGVLQRIALTYTVAALLVQRFGTRGASVAMVASLIVYAVALPLCGDLSLENNGPRTLDLFLLGPAHLYTGEGIPFDPEGLFSTLPALANVLGGYLAGRWLAARGSNASAVIRLAVAGALALAIALLWQWQVPLNKKLWTSSYALLNLGIDALALSVLAYTVDVRGWRAGRAFFEPLGANTLAIYLVSELGNLLISRTYVGQTNTFEWLHATFFAPWAGAKFGSLLYCLSYLLLCWAVAYALAQRQIRIRL